MIRYANFDAYLHKKMDNWMTERSPGMTPLDFAGGYIKNAV